MDDTPITEFEKLDPTRVDAVSSPANGIGFLMLKSLEDEDVLTKACGVDECGVCEKKKLKAADRKKLPDSDFALPEKRAYPIQDENHAHAALSMLHNASPGDQKRIKAAVHRRYPNIKQDGDKAKKETTMEIEGAEKEVSTGESLSQTTGYEDDAEPAGPNPEAGDGGQPRHVAAVEEHPAENSGAGDTAPDKALPKGEALGQTHSDPATKSEVDMTGDPAGCGDDAGAKTEALSQTNEMQPSAKSTEDVREVSSLSAATEAAIKRLNLDPSRKVEEMQIDELMKLLDERDAARQLLDDTAAKAAKKSEKKAQKAAAAAEAAKAAEEAAKAAEGEGAVADESVAMKSLEERLAALEALPGKQPFLNGVGVTAMLRGPESGSILKTLDDAVDVAKARLEKANTSGSELEKTRAKAEFDAANQRRIRAKMVALDNARDRGELPAGRFGKNTAAIFGEMAGCTTYSLPAEEIGLRYWDGKR